MFIALINLLLDRTYDINQSIKAKIKTIIDHRIRQDRSIHRLLFLSKVILMDEYLKFIEFF